MRTTTTARALIPTIVFVVALPLGAPGCWARSATTASGPPAYAAREPLSCEALRNLALPHVTLIEANIVAAGPSPFGGAPLPEHCHVLGLSRPTARSEIRFAVAIPVGARWNGRYLQVGNIAFAGRIPERLMDEGLAAGYAVAGTDDGHQTTSVFDTTWAMGHPERVVDYGYRALAETTRAAKSLIRAFTGRDPARSYFQGCSNGGREAMMEAQRFPSDFDGIVAGAPGDGTRGAFVGPWFAQALLATPESNIPQSKFETIEMAVRKACGDEDGVIEDPLSCHFDPAALACRGADGDACLTPPQIAALRRIYAGPTNPRTGEQIAPGLEPGSASRWRSIPGWSPGEPDWAGKLPGSAFFRYFVYEEPLFDVRRLNFDEDVAVAVRKVGSVLDATADDLSAFRARGGKLLHYQGWADAVSPPRGSIAYYERVQAKMGETSDFYRLFMAPGMRHCGDGPGPNELATFEAIVAWVEQGRAPDRVLATKYTDDDPDKPVVRTRPLCPYPQRAAWDGRGNRDRAESYRCGSP